VSFEILTVVVPCHQMTQWHFSEGQNSDCISVYGRLLYMLSEHWLWICIVSYQEGNKRECMFMWWTPTPLWKGKLHLFSPQSPSY